MAVRRLNHAVLYVRDLAATVDFYRGALGFEVRTDSGAGDESRWVEVAPPGATTTIAIVAPRGGMWGSVGVDTRISLTSLALDADHASLRARGVDVDDDILRIGGPVPPMFFLRDPDGNTLPVVQGD